MEAEPYKNITLSIFLKHDNLTVNEHFRLNQIVSLACVNFLNDFDKGFKIKWPNDLVHGNSKIAGILIENQLDKDKIKNSIVGIGLNVNQSEFGDFNASSLKNICFQEFNIQELILKLIHSLNEYFNVLLNKDYNFIQKAYEQNLWLFNEKSLFKDKDGEFKGQIIGISELGQLIVKKKSSIFKYQFKEIVFLARNT